MHGQTPTSYYYAQEGGSWAVQPGTGETHAGGGKKGEKRANLLGAHRSFSVLAVGSSTVSVCREGLTWNLLCSWLGYHPSGSRAVSSLFVS